MFPCVARKALFKFLRKLPQDTKTYIIISNQTDDIFTAFFSGTIPISGSFQTSYMSYILIDISEEFITSPYSDRTVYKYFLKEQ